MMLARKQGPRACGAMLRWPLLTLLALVLLLVNLSPASSASLKLGRGPRITITQVTRCARNVWF